MSKKKRPKKDLRKRTRQEELAGRWRDRLAWAIEHDPEFRDGMLAQIEGFKAKFGRSPAPGDPTFFDPSKDAPTPMSEAEGNAIDEEFIAATIRIGHPDYPEWIMLSLKVEGPDGLRSKRLLARVGAEFGKALRP